LIERIDIRGFRNLVEQVWCPAPGRNLLLGPNGAGKTSLLEAVYLGATSRSFRSPRLADCVRFGGDAFFVRIDLSAGTRLEMGWQPGRGRHAVDGLEVPLAEYLRHLPVVVWTHATAEVLSGDPVLGRRLLDRGVVGCQPSDLALLRRYRHVLAQKRELLSRGSTAGIGAWNDLLAEAAVAIVERRREIVERLVEALGWALAASRLEGPGLELVYRPSPREALDGRPAAREALERVLTREKERRMPLVGPHRDRLRFRWRGRPLHRIASAGERKGLSLLLTAAEARMLAVEGRPPVVLLDDVDAELDAGRLARVWPAFAAAEQVLGTSNRPGVWDTPETVTAWCVSGGAIVRSET
jgi:DNA replication and repair protein RecF